MVKQGKNVRSESPLVSLRERVGKTQFQVAIEVGVTPQTVGAWERGAIPHLDKAVKLAGSLGLSLEDLCEAFGLVVGKNEET